MSTLKEDREIIIKHLIDLDGCNREEALETIRNMKKAILEGESPEDILHDIGLEQDYILALIL